MATINSIFNTQSSDSKKRSFICRATPEDIYKLIPEEVVIPEENEFELVMEDIRDFHTDLRLNIQNTNFKSLPASMVESDIEKYLSDLDESSQYEIQKILAETDSREKANVIYCGNFARREMSSQELNEFLMDNLDDDNLN